MASPISRAERPRFSLAWLRMRLLRRMSASARAAKRLASGVADHVPALDHLGAAASER